MRKEEEVTHAFEWFLDAREMENDGTFGDLQLLKAIFKIYFLVF